MVNRNAFDRVKHAKIIECMENLDIWERHQLDKQSVLESKSIHEIQRTEEELSPEIQIMRVRPRCVITLSV